MRALAAVGLILVLLAAALPSSLSAQEPTRKKPVVSYFPLQVGNWWIYEGFLGNVSVTDRVTAANGFDYFVLDGYLGKRQVRVSRFDVVSELNAAGGEDFLWYMLGAPVGTTWEFRLAPGRDSCLSGVSMVVASRTDVVRVPAGEFRNVVRLERRGPVRCGDFALGSEWFAPGVGLIRRQQLTISGLETSELLEAQVGGMLVRHPRYDASLSLDQPLYTYDLFPPVGSDPFPILRAVFLLRNESDTPLSFSFLGCKRATFSILNAAGQQVLGAQVPVYPCSDPTAPVDFTLANGSWGIAASFQLKTTSGSVLPDGRYSVVATLDTVDPVPLRPSARAVFDVSTTR